jgi:hypothetical protein
MSHADAVFLLGGRCSSFCIARRKKCMSRQPGGETGLRRFPASALSPVSRKMRQA